MADGNGRAAVMEATKAIIEDRQAREKACMEKLNETLKAISEEFGCQIGAAPFIAEGRIAARIVVAAK